MLIQGKYRFENTLLDSSGNLRHASSSGTAYYTSNLIGKNSQASQVEIPIYDIDVLDLTVCFNILWYYASEGDDQEYWIFRVLDSSNNIIHGLSLVENEIILTVFGTREPLGNYIDQSDISDYVKIHFGYTGTHKQFILSSIKGFYGDSSTLASPPSNVINKIEVWSDTSFIDEFVIGKGSVNDVDFRKMAIGLKPYYSKPIPTIYDTFRNNVLRDGGTFDEVAFREAWNSLKPIARTEPTCLILPGAVFVTI